MNKPIVIASSIIVAVLVIGAVAYAFWATPKNVSMPCTQEAKICPDGSAVGRTGPNCSFAACPTQTPPPLTACTSNADCQDGASCLTEGPLIANQPVHKVCVPKGQAIPL